MVNVGDHVLNRGNGRNTVFGKDGDYAVFLKLLKRAGRRTGPDAAGSLLLDAQSFLLGALAKAGWRPEYLDEMADEIACSTVRSARRFLRSSLAGKISIQSDEQLLTVMRCVELNPVREVSIPIRKAQRLPGASIGSPPADAVKPQRNKGAVDRRQYGLEWVIHSLTPAERDSFALCLARGQPLGHKKWKIKVEERSGIESSLRPMQAQREEAWTLLAPLTSNSQY